MSEYINITEDNLLAEHLCCAISDKKHQTGVNVKRQWLSERIKEGHVFRKLNEKGKVFIEYAPLEKAWVPVVGKNYMYIYCLWVAGSFKGKGHGKALLEYCIEDAESRGKSGICVIRACSKTIKYQKGKSVSVSKRRYEVNGDAKTTRADEQGVESDRAVAAQARETRRKAKTR